MTTDDDTVPAGAAQAIVTTTGWRAELGAMLKLAWPLVLAQLAQNALLTTDVIMMGWLGPEALAAGSLAVSFISVFLIGSIGLVGTVAALVAQARGAGDVKGVRRTVRQGLWVAIAIALILIPIVWQAGPILTALGQSPQTVATAEAFVHTGSLLFLPSLVVIVFRSFLAAFGNTRIVLWVTIAGVFINAASNYCLMFGNFGFPALGVRGAAISTTLVNTAMALMLIAYVQTHRKYRRYHILVRFWKPDWPRFLQILRIGAPIGLMLVAEVGLFSAASILMGQLGTNELAAHAVALQCASLAFMVPLGISQATTVRVGFAFGRGDAIGVGQAGWVALVVTLGFMAATATAFLLLPQAIVGLFLNPADPANLVALGHAAAYLGIAGLFQLVDGAQVTMAGALRGLNDTTAPMIIALVGYWAVGLPVAYALAFPLGWRGTGVWSGLAAGLACVAVVLTIRFAWRERLHLVPGS